MDTKKLSEIALIFLGAGLVVFVFDYFESFMRPLMIAFILSFFFTPLYRQTKKKRIRQIAKMIFVAVIIVGCLIVIGNYLIEGITDFAKNNELTDIDSYKNMSITLGDKEYSVSQYVDADGLKNAASSMISITLSSVRGFVSEFFLIIIFLVFITPAHIKWMKSAKDNKFMNSVKGMEKSVKEYLKVKTIISAITAIASMIVMLIFGVKFVMLFTIMIFVFNFVPTIGSIVAVSVVVFVQFVSAGFSVPLLIMALLLIAIQFTLGNYIEPKFTGERLKISPLIVLIGLFFWGTIWGLGGMFFSVPLTLSIKMLLSQNKDTEELTHVLD